MLYFLTWAFFLFYYFLFVNFFDLQINDVYKSYDTLVSIRFLFNAHCRTCTRRETDGNYSYVGTQGGGAWVR